MGSEFKVLRIDELSRLSETGQIERYYRHQVKTKGGVILTIDIDEKNFTAAKVAPIIQEKVAEADKILKL